MKKEITVRQLNEKTNFFDNDSVDADFNDNFQIIEEDLGKGILFKLKRKFSKNIKHKNGDITKNFKNNKVNCMNNIEALKLMMIRYSLRKIDAKIKKINVFNSGVFQTLLGIGLACFSVVGLSYWLTDDKIILYILSLMSVLLIVFQSVKNIKGLSKFKKHLLNGSLLYTKKYKNEKIIFFDKHDCYTLTRFQKEKISECLNSELLVLPVEQNTIDELMQEMIKLCGFSVALMLPNFGNKLFFIIDELEKIKQLIDSDNIIGIKYKN